jgi:ATP-dependent protease ClpP protease subunit
MYNKLSKEMEIKFTENYPMSIIYNIDGEKAKIVYYLAPKVNDKLVNEQTYLTAIEAKELGLIDEILKYE